MGIKRFEINYFTPDFHVDEYMYANQSLVIIVNHCLFFIISLCFHIYFKFHSRKYLYFFMFPL